MALLAEVSDKSLLPDHPLVIGLVVAVGVLVFGCVMATRSRKAAFLPAVFALGVPVLWIVELIEPRLGPILRQELEIPYLVSVGMGFGVPYVAAVIALLPLSARIARAASNHARVCHRCRYDFRGRKSDRCPECGAPRPGTPTATEPTSTSSV